MSSLLAAALLVSLLAALAPPAGAVLAAASDFNCDGYSDLAVGVPGEALGAGPHSGAVQVFFGSNSGLKPGATMLSIGVAGTPGTPASGDGFGSVIATGRFDDDTCDDLAVAAPGADVGAVTDAGAVYLFFGDNGGFDLTRTRRITRGSAGIPGSNQVANHFGSVLAAGDANGDFTDDLAVGVPNDDVNGVSDAGSVTVIDGPGLHQNYTATLFRRGAGGVPGSPAFHERFGGALAFGNFAFADLADFSSELAIGAPGADADGLKDSGAIVVLPSSVAGLTGAGSIELSQDSPGVPGNSEAGDRFGSTLVGGTFIGNDDASDLAVGVPYEDVGSRVDAGVVVVLGGSTTGIGGAGAPAGLLLYQGFGGMAGASETSDRFGYSLAAGQFADTDADTSLVIGVPYEDVGSVASGGAVDIVPGVNGELAPATTMVFYQGAGGVPGTTETGDAFGLRLQVGDYDGSGAADLAVGAPLENVGAVVDAGAVTVLSSDGNAIAPAAVTPKLLFQDASGVPDSSETGDHFGML